MSFMMPRGERWRSETVPWLGHDTLMVDSRITASSKLHTKGNCRRCKELAPVLPDDLTKLQMIELVGVDQMELEGGRLSLL